MRLNQRSNGSGLLRSVCRRRSSITAATLAGCLAAMPVLAQTPPEEPPPPPTAPAEGQIPPAAAPSGGETMPPAAPTETPAQTPKTPVDVPETVRKANALVEQADDADDLEKVRPLIEELRELVALVNENEPLNESLPFLRGTYLAYIGRLGDALDDLTKYLESRTGRTDYRGHRQLGDVYLQLNYPTMALARYESADRLKPNDSKILLGLAKASQQLGRKDKTAEYVIRAVDTAPADKRGPYLQFATRTLIAQKKWDDADRYARDAMQRTRAELEAEPTKLALLQTLDGLCNLRIQIAQGRLLDDAKAVQPRLDIVDISRELVTIRGRSAVHEQLAVIDQGLTANDPDKPIKLLERQAQLLTEIGRAEDAREAYRTLLELDPGNTAAKAYLAEPSTDAANTHAAQSGSAGGEG